MGIEVTDYDILIKHGLISSVSEPTKIIIKTIFFSSDSNKIVTLDSNIILMRQVPFSGQYAVGVEISNSGSDDDRDYGRRIVPKNEFKYPNGFRRNDD